MPFSLLKKIIGRLQKTSRCKSCGSPFTEELIFIVATAMDPAAGFCNGIFMVVCPKCALQSFVMMEMRNLNAQTQQIKEEFIHIETKSTVKKISTNDILDMHNFLKEWRGDVRELFKEV